MIQGGGGGNNDLAQYKKLGATSSASTALASQTLDGATRWEIERACETSKLRLLRAQRPQWLIRKGFPINPTEA